MTKQAQLMKEIENDVEDLDRRFASFFEEYEAKYGPLKSVKEMKEDDKTFRKHRHK